MSFLQNLLWNAARVARAIWQLFGYAMTFFLALVQPRATLAARLLAVESQLAVCKNRFQEKKAPGSF